MAVKPTLCLLKAWDANARCLRLNDGRRIEISPDTITAVYGLPHGVGTYIITKEKTSLPDEFCEEMQLKLNLCKEGEYIIDWARLLHLLHLDKWGDMMDVVDY